ncbi:MAG: beta-N-acetylglucosaminidase domain-containing protein [Fimbriimonadales bacterium]
MPILIQLAVNLAVIQSSTAMIRVPGSQFTGGANKLYGSFRSGEHVNYVYAASTGVTSKMTLEFDLGEAPRSRLSLFLRAQDDETPGRRHIDILVNGTSIFRAVDSFAERGWNITEFPIAAGLLKAGPNEIEIDNLEPEGKLGMPPWVMVAEAAIASHGYKWEADIVHDFRVQLPKVARPIPEPLKPGEKPGFALRGIKGWMWLPQKYIEQIPFLAAHKMNFLMNCYGSMCDVEHYAWGDPNINRWWEPLPESKKRAYEKVVRLCQEKGISYCFSMNPNLCSKRPLRYDSKEDLEALWKHYAWMQGLGVHWFNISLDDIGEGIEASGQARLANEFYRRLRAKDPDAHLILCPTWYWGDGTDPSQRPYLETLAKELNPDIYLFWTGDEVVGPITRRAADSYKSIVKHRLFLWDNYPVNDDNPTMHLGPVIHRDPNLGEIIDGYMSNSMCKQDIADRLALLTCADYAYNPRAYDPARSIGQSIMNLGKTDNQRGVLRDLVELYPGMLLFGAGTSFNPARQEFDRLATEPHSIFAVESYMRGLEELDARMKMAFPSDFLDARKTLDDDIAWMRSQFKARYGRVSG